MSNDSEYYRHTRDIYAYGKSALSAWQAFCRKVNNFVASNEPCAIHYLSFTMIREEEQVHVFGVLIYDHWA